jgi:hypothetical protein
MKQKLLLILAFCLVAFIGTWAQTATTPSGSGTESNSYQIANLKNRYCLVCFLFLMGINTSN